MRFALIIIIKNQWPLPKQQGRSGMSTGLFPGLAFLVFPVCPVPVPAGSSQTSPPGAGFRFRPTAPAVLLPGSVHSTMLLWPSFYNVPSLCPGSPGWPSQACHVEELAAHKGLLTESHRTLHQSLQHQSAVKVVIDGHLSFLCQKPIHGSGSAPGKLYPTMSFRLEIMSFKWVCMHGACLSACHCPGLNRWTPGYQGKQPHWSQGY